jgi:hypothetical protein
MMTGSTSYPLRDKSEREQQDITPTIEELEQHGFPDNAGEEQEAHGWPRLAPLRP